jgi:hypothetical protein
MYFKFRKTNPKTLLFWQKNIQIFPQKSFLKVLVPKLFSHFGKILHQKNYGQDYYYNIYTSSKIIILFSGILKLSILFQKQFF